MATAMTIQIVDILNAITDLHIRAAGDNVQHFLEFATEFRALLTTISNQLAATARQISLDPDVSADINSALNQASIAINRAKRFGQPGGKSTAISQIGVTSALQPVASLAATPVAEVAPVEEVAPVAEIAPVEEVAPVEAPTPAPAPIYRFF
jgi:hypothetical protein